MLVEFSLTCIFHHVWEKFLKFMVFTFLSIFTIAPVPHSKLQAEFFENLFPPTAERGGENYDLLYQNSIRKYEGDLEHLFNLEYLYFV